MANIAVMNTGLYNPFQNFDFLYKICFLSGKTFNSPVVQVPLIPKMAVRTGWFKRRRADPVFG